MHTSVILALYCLYKL